jgi:copper chaperone
MQRQMITVEGMSCTGCERNVTSALKAVDGVHRAEADHETGDVEIVVEDETDTDSLTQAIYDAGYDVSA